VLRLVNSTPDPSPSRRPGTRRFVDPNAVALRVAARVRAVRADRDRQQQTRDRSELLSSISHELRTPLTSVIGYTEILLGQDAGELNAEQAAMLERVAANGERLFELIDGLLSAANERNLDGDSVDVSDVVSQVVRASCGVDGPIPPA
jgi:signal transduction histidine kinase